MIASVPGVAALMSARGWVNWGSYRAGKNPHRRADYLRAAADPDVVRSDPAAAGYPAFPARAADGALLPAVQTLLVYNSTSQIPGAFSAITSRSAISATSPAH
jgi:DHA1 family multidrug resistance protein-like MFS transporter